MLNDEANSISRFRRWHCYFLAHWLADRARKTMQCRGAIKSAGALDLSDYRWTKMLVRRQNHAFEIIVAVARAGSSTSDFRWGANKGPHGEAQQSAGFTSVGTRRLR